MNGLSEELKKRTDNDQAEAPATFLFIHGLQNFKNSARMTISVSRPVKAKPTSGAVPKLTTEGPSHGMHVVVTLDTYNNVNRFLGRNR